jgi:hypothetical protein
MRALIARRLRGWTLVGLKCATIDARHARCSFRARRGPRRAAGAGTLVLSSASRRVTLKLRVHLTGPLGRRTAWTGGATI